MIPILASVGVGIIILLVLSVFIFWFAMIIDCCKRKFNKGIERLIWILILIFLCPLGMIIYYFLIKKYNPDGLLDSEGHLR